MLYAKDLSFAADVDNQSLKHCKINSLWLPADAKCSSNFSLVGNFSDFLKLCTAASPSPIPPSLTASCILDKLWCWNLHDLNASFCYLCSFHDLVNKVKKHPYFLNFVCCLAKITLGMKIAWYFCYPLERCLGTIFRRSCHFVP